MGELELTAAMARLADITPGSEDAVCCYCRTVTREELLHDADERLWPMERLCEECGESLQSDLDDELPSESEMRGREAALRMGGGGWLDE